MKRKLRAPALTYKSWATSRTPSIIGSSSSSSVFPQSLIPMNMTSNNSQ
jgi:hypothetical protein